MARARGVRAGSSPRADGGWLTIVSLSGVTALAPNGVSAATPTLVPAMAPPEYYRMKECLQVAKELDPNTLECGRREYGELCIYEDPFTRQPRYTEDYRFYDCLSENVRRDALPGRKRNNPAMYKALLDARNEALIEERAFLNRYAANSAYRASPCTIL